MSTPSNFHEFPNPTGEAAGVNSRDAGSQSPSKIAQKYRPKGVPVSEPGVATLARFAGRLVDRETGRAYSADELAQRIADQTRVIPEILTVDGTLSNTDSSPITTPLQLTYAGQSGGKPMWSADGTSGATTNYVKWKADQKPFPVWETKLSTGYNASSTQDTELPIGLAWTNAIGSGSPLITSGAAVTNAAVAAAIADDPAAVREAAGAADKDMTQTAEKFILGPRAAGPFNSEDDARNSGLKAGQSYMLANGTLAVMREAFSPGSLHYIPLNDNDDLGTAAASLTITGTDTRAAGRFGNGFSFNGSTYIEFPSPLVTTSPYAIFLTVIPKGASNDQIIISRSAGSGSRDFYLQFDNSQSRFVIGHYNNASSVTEGNFPVDCSRGSAFRVGFGFDGTNFWASLDGEQVYSVVPASLDSSPSVNIRLGGPLDLGSGSTFYNGFTGVIQEVVIYQSAITSEPDALWNYGFGTHDGYKVPVAKPTTSDTQNVIISAGQSNGQIGETDWTTQSSTWPAIGADSRVAFAGSDSVTTTTGWEYLRYRQWQTGPTYHAMQRLTDWGFPSLHSINRNISGLAIAGWDSGATNWTNLLAFVSEKNALLSNPRIRAVVWNQGESDAVNSTLANAYQAKLTSLISRMRAEWGSDLPFVLVVPDLTGAGLTWGPQIETVRAAIFAVAAADDRVVTVDTRGFSRPEDGIHVSQRDQQKIGLLIAEALAPFLSE